MGSIWRRTSARASWANHSLVRPTADGLGKTSAFVQWPTEHHATASIWEDPRGGGWHWKFSVNGQTAWTGTTKRESGAKAQVLRRARTHVLEVAALLGVPDGVEVRP